MRVLVTGSSGFIGQHVGAELEARGDVGIVYDRPHDVCDLNLLEFACRVSQAEAIINLAGKLGTPELFGSQYEAARVNVLGAVNVYDVAARLGGIPVVQIGTGHKGQPNPYAITKACGEDLGLARARWLGEKITVVRAYHVYGPGQLPGPPHGPASVHKFFPTFACRALTGLPLELCGGGSQLIDPVHVSDVAVSLCDAISGPYGTVTEAGCGKPLSVAQVATDIGMWARGGKAFCLEPGLVDAPPRPGEPEGAEVVATDPVCGNPWPYLVGETVEWYREWLNRSSV